MPQWQQDLVFLKTVNIFFPPHNPDFHSFLNIFQIHSEVIHSVHIILTIAGCYYMHHQKRTNLLLSFSFCSFKMTVMAKPG